MTAIDVELGLEHALGEQVCPDAGLVEARHFGRQLSAASGTHRPRQDLVSPAHRGALHHRHRVRWKDRHANVRAAGDGLAVVAVAVELLYRRALDRHLDGAAQATDLDRLHASRIRLATSRSRITHSASAANFSSDISGWRNSVSTSSHASPF